MLMPATSTSLMSPTRLSSLWFVYVPTFWTKNPLRRISSLSRCLARASFRCRNLERLGTTSLISTLFWMPWRTSTSAAPALCAALRVGGGPGSWIPKRSRALLLLPKRCSTKYSWSSASRATQKSSWHSARPPPLSTSAACRSEVTSRVSSSWATPSYACSSPSPHSAKALRHHHTGAAGGGAWKSARSLGGSASGGSSAAAATGEPGIAPSGQRCWA
mmetsp:Transcript_119706/g.321337  ORF Transcript_119706/g.321337 Transcript_119706/m.321337 type:complete len:218 (+) Transcript_119706:640-1293(+)